MRGVAIVKDVVVVWKEVSTIPGFRHSASSFNNHFAGWNILTKRTPRRRFS